jgi:uncharacterized protein YlxW (UPF0749 family)
MPEQVDPTNGPDAGEAPDPTDAGSNEAAETDAAAETDQTEAVPDPERSESVEQPAEGTEPSAEGSEPPAESAEATTPTESDETDETAAPTETDETAAPTETEETAAATETEETAAATETEETAAATEAPEPTPTPTSDATAPPSPAAEDAASAPDGVRKLLGVVRARPGRGQIMVAILLAVLAFGAVVQGRTVSGSGDYAGARRGDLIQLLDSLDAARDRAESELRDLQATKQQLENEGTRTQVALREAREEANTLAILSGAVGATGPGIVIRIDDPDDQVGASNLLNFIEELRDAGAEAIEINDTARIVAQTYLADDADGVSIDGTVVSPPFIIDVIGHPHTLSEAVEFPGGITEIVSTLGGSVDVDERDTVDVTSLAVRGSAVTT